MSDAGAEQIDQLVVKVPGADRLCDLAETLKPVFVIQVKHRRLAVGFRYDIMCHWALTVLKVAPARLPDTRRQCRRPRFRR